MENAGEAIAESVIAIAARHNITSLTFLIGKGKQWR